MIATAKPLLTMTAADLMTRNVTVLPRAMSLRAAAHLLSEMQISGAPVVDETGECIGILSATDFMHQVGYGKQAACHPPAVNPGCIHSPWQIVNVEELPTEDVAAFMTADPVTVSPGTSIAELAREMMDAHIHRIIVVDARNRPVGVVSSTDVLAAVANAKDPVPSSRFSPRSFASAGKEMP
jgi:CBS domain-containing protein